MHTNVSNEIAPNMRNGFVSMNAAASYSVIIEGARFSKTAESCEHRKIIMCLAIEKEPESRFPDLQALYFSFLSEAVPHFEIYFSKPFNPSINTLFITRAEGKAEMRRSCFIQEKSIAGNEINALLICLFQHVRCVDK